jgi:hypothetical protein
MATNDFDFKTNQGHFRGCGTRALVALAIVHAPRALAYVSSALVGVRYVIPWVQEIVRAHF